MKRNSPYICTYELKLFHSILINKFTPSNHLDGVCFYLQSKSAGVTCYRYRTHDQAPFCLLPISS